MSISNTQATIDSVLGVFCMEVGGGGGGSSVVERTTFDQPGRKFCGIEVFEGWWIMAFNATFNNITVISWRSVLLAEKTEKTTDLPQVTDNLLSHNVVSSTPRLSGIRNHNVIGGRH